MTRYRIDDLARAAGSTVRNVRSYQEKGLVPPPVREGRAAFYSEEHVARLRTIAALLERGFTLQNISELLRRWEDGQDIRDVLGVEAALTSPFSDEEASDVDLEDIVSLYGEMSSDVVARAIAVGLVEPTNDQGKLRVRSLRLLRAGAELQEAGVPVDALLDELEHLHVDVDRIAERFVGLVVKNVLAPRLACEPDFPEIEDLVRRIRPLAKRVVDAELSRALETHVRAALGEELRVLASKSPLRREAKEA